MPLCHRHFVNLMFSNVLLFTMVLTKSKLNEISKEELTEELLSFDNVSEKINDLTKKMDYFASKFHRVFCELLISKTCNSL